MYDKYNSMKLIKISQKQEPLCGDCAQQLKDGFCRKYNCPAKHIYNCPYQLTNSELVRLGYMTRKAKEREAACD